METDMNLQIPQTFKYNLEESLRLTRPIRIKPCKYFKEYQAKILLHGLLRMSRNMSLKFLQLNHSTLCLIDVSTPL